ncbi:desmoglein-2-like isoform X2 [Clupea harengus]|nr:desmoglein-2-like isoform X2 [Clupea harengus]
MENEDYTKWEYIAKIRSDEEINVRYSLVGKGASEEPFNLFTVNEKTGYVRIHGILDREETPSYHLKGVAMFTDGNRAEKDIDLVIVVEDQNDCPPVFSFEITGEVSEASATGTYVMKVNATDADKPGTLHSQIAYSIVAGGGSMFYINQKTGEIHVKQQTLDRETLDTYTLTIKGTDMNGSPGGLSGTGKFVVKILDVNDNIPTLENTYYEAKVMENTFNVTVLRIKALDADLIHTDNWLALFTIVSGNEAGYFSITTDSKTNEGILVLNKALDYEQLKELNLLVAVSNKAEYHSSIITSTTKTKTYPIKIHVQNEPEGPRFQPLVKVVRVSEDHTTINLKEVITTYAAIDSDTLLIATNVIYAKGEDKHNWITIDQHTAEIRLNKLPDRESLHLVNGTYYAKIICITTDFPRKTATGTIAIQVEDFNDNCPTLTSTNQTVCFQENVVYVTAVDGDAYPNGAPFEFKVVSNTKEEWSVERLNDSTAILRPKESLWPGRYKVFMVIKDQQGKACDNDQVLHLEVCSCTKDNKCLPRLDRRPSATLGPAGILLMLLGLLLLFLLPLLLLFCLCGGAGDVGGFKPMPWEAKQHLVDYNCEGQGEDKDVPMVFFPTEVDGGLVTKGKVDLIGAAGSHLSQSNINNGHYHWFNQVNTDHGTWYGQHGQGFGGSSVQRGAFEGIALSEEFLRNYYSNKASCVEGLESAKENLLIYEYEGQESPVGSVGCCSLLEEDHDLEFLNDLGPKFKTLAGICGGAAFEFESSKVMVPAPQPSASHVTNVCSSGEISQSISAAKADAKSLATSSTMVQESVSSTTCHAATNMHLQENRVVPTQTLLIQQPTLYYAAAPPMYVVDPHPHPTLLVGPTVNVGENLVMVERQATTGGSIQLQGIRQGVVGLDNLQGAHSLVLVEGRASAAGDPQVMVERHATTGGSIQLQGIRQGAVGLENLQGAHSLVLVEGRASAAGDPHQIIGTLGRRQVVEMQQGMGSSSVNQMGYGVTSGNISLSETAVTAGSGRLQHEGSGGFIQVVPSQSHMSQSVEVRGQSASLNVPLETNKVFVQERVSFTERNMQSSSIA